MHAMKTATAKMVASIGWLVCPDLQKLDVSHRYGVAMMDTFIGALRQKRKLSPDTLAKKCAVEPAPEIAALNNVTTAADTIMASVALRRRMRSKGTIIRAGNN